MLINDTTNAVVNAVRYEMKGQATWEKFVTENQVTKETVGETSKQIAALVFPKSDGTLTENGKRTPFGNAAQLAAYHMRSALKRLAGDDGDAEPGTTNLLTADGVKALAGMDADAIMAAIRAELDKRVKA